MLGPVSDPYDPDTQTPELIGYLPPAEAFVPVGGDEDPLVNPVVDGMAGWAHRVGGVLRRGWPVLLGLFALTQLLPSLVFKVLVVYGVTGVHGIGPLSRVADSSVLVTSMAQTSLVALVLLLAPRMLGYAAAAYAAVRQADAQPVTFGGALRYGLRRFVGLTVWHVAAVALVGIVFYVLLCCSVQAAQSWLGLLPAVLLAAYLCLCVAFLGPAYLFERAAPMTRSRTLTHARFWPTTGRLVPLGLVSLLGLVLDSLLARLAVMAQLTDVLPVAVLDVAVSLVAGLVLLPLSVVQFSGVLVAYAEARGHTGELVRTSLLAAELG
ncbi:hypothetical protein Cs7R123_36930 [Catellatospora sp. TT07R-123]|uniref:hypothetical protein n=1 Tax=Catellatospora sp. TT07R-123 TaxID=2733863 RepID=UPI001B27D6FA|nr:hypothetical protein [Catellatospora sp. TT07R-123]GHJ46351.1 hypothetical protein Cs7R123_36930 [Catellatospora sp. TT07R-123]